jgi:hypothetical protein
MFRLDGIFGDRSLLATFTDAASYEDMAPLQAAVVVVQRYHSLTHKLLQVAKKRTIAHLFVIILL